MYTRHHTQLSASFYVSIYQDDLTASTRYQNYWHVCMHVCRYVHIYYAPSKSTHYFCHGTKMGKNKKYFSHLAREAYQVCACVRAIYTLLITHNSVQVFTSLYIKMTLLQALLITFICMYVHTHTLSTPAVAEYLPASQLVQTVEPAIYVHTLSHTTKGGAR